MENIVQEFFQNLEIGEAQQFKNLAIFPLFSTLSQGPQYLTMRQAMDAGELSIREVDQDGAVPELMVVNRAERPVLLLDGEELAGAKQNRVINTTILLKKLSETIIPVSCTEAGRWSYVSKEFSESGCFMSPSLREVKSRTVSDNLRTSKRYASDQGALWQGIDTLAEAADTEAPTRAMRDVFSSRSEDIDDYVQHLPKLNHQRGLMLCLGGNVAGCDILLRESAYALLHDKFVKSYVMDAIVTKKKKDSVPSQKTAAAFLQTAQKCEEQKFKSIGHGFDYRYKGKSMVGSALVYQQKVIHTAFFKLNKGNNDDRMKGFMSRRSYRV